MTCPLDGNTCNLVLNLLDSFSVLGERCGLSGRHAVLQCVFGQAWESAVGAESEKTPSDRPRSRTSAPERGQVGRL